MSTALAPRPVQPGPPARKPRISTRNRAAIAIGSVLAFLVFGVIGAVTVSPGTSNDATGILREKKDTS